MNQPTEPYKHRYRGHNIFRPKAAAPFLMPSSSESEEDSNTKEQQFPSAELLKKLLLWGSSTTATNTAASSTSTITAAEEIHVELWRDEETRQADEDLLDSFRQMMDDMIQQAIRDIELGNY